MNHKKLIAKMHLPIIKLGPDKKILKEKRKTKEKLE